MTGEIVLLAGSASALALGRLIRSFGNRPSTVENMWHRYLDHRRDMEVLRQSAAIQVLLSTNLGAEQVTVDQCRDVIDTMLRHVPPRQYRSRPEEPARAGDSPRESAEALEGSAPSYLPNRADNAMAAHSA